jgi:hypothetical protein
MKTVYEEIDINCVTVSTIFGYLEQIENEIINDNNDDFLYLFRGEYEDFGDTAMQPSIYRKENKNILKSEHILFREIKRFNGIDFSEDTTTLDHLSRMQHYSMPTRLIDLSEDPLAALWFAISAAEEKGLSANRIVYMLRIRKSNIKYFDSDTATIIANLAKLPLNGVIKSKEKILDAVRAVMSTKRKCYSSKRIDNLKKHKCMGYLYHEIRNDVSHFLEIINPEHLVSVQCIKPKLSNTRIHSQKGAFLLFGLNFDSCDLNIPLIRVVSGKPKLLKSILNINKNPIESIVKISITNNVTVKLLDKMGTKKPYIYPEMEIVSKYFSKYFA